ncbi:MAG: T9SS type A sorting domain-containing protein [Chitinophagaceae bacterium]|nr:T9SS type A sorting domain-containing protein [Chitinophagaceae bacterium]
MRKPLLMAGIALLFLSVPNLKAQINLSWASSFSPTWNSGNTTGTAPNIGGYSINCSASATINGGGTFMQALGSSGAPTPTVSGATFTVPGTTNRLQVTPNYTSNTSYTDIILTFTSPATNVAFKIVDIDKNNSTSTTYFDQVTVTGTHGATTYNATLTKYDATTDPSFLVISGNVAHVNTTSSIAGNTASDASDQRGTVNVNFGTTTLSSIRIRYDNATGADSNPASQAIAIGSVSFDFSTLPVDMLSFSGIRQNENVLLNWKTIQEFNSASFEIERSNGTNSWEKTGTVAASGNSTTEKSYHFLDVNAQGSLLLYRLKQIDIDNNYKYSGIVKITAKAAVTDILAYPNPFTSQINISVNSDNDQPVLILLYDVNGKMIRKETNTLYAGSNSITINTLEKMANGIYYLEVKDKTGLLLGRSMLLKN